MARPRKQVRLEDGLKLEVNKLVRQGFWPRGNEPLTFSTQWTSNRLGMIASALSTNDNSKIGSIFPLLLRQAVVLQVPSHGWQIFGRVDATRRGPLLQPSSEDQIDDLEDRLREIENR